MIAQIRTTLWVRNGFAIRGQLLHYRDYMLRELCYDQDLFILQTALVIIPPDLVIVSILDRFALLGYFSGSYLHSQYEGAQLGSMVEEVFYVFITILSENANASKMPMHLAIRREIVHALAMGPCSFSDLVKRVAERLVDDSSFEGMLREVANFRPPEGPTETGLYELKDEAYDEVNPFFYHYTRNRREEVENVLRKRMEKRTGKKEWEVVLTPKPFGVTEGPYKGVSDVWEREIMMQILFYAIWNVLVVTDTGSSSGGPGSSPPSAEAILDQALHMIMLGVIERPSGFCNLAAAKRFDGKTVVDMLWTLSRHEKYAKLYKARVDWIFEKMELQIPDELKRIRGPAARLGDNEGGSGTRTPGMDKDEARKRAAKKRQEAIMLQMKAQQASFASMFGQGESGSEEDSELDDSDTSMADVHGSDEEEAISFGTCIVCQEDLTSTSAASGKPFGALGLVQPSRIIRRHPDLQPSYLNEVLQAPVSMDRTTISTAFGPVSGPGSIPSFPPLNADQLDARSTSHNFEGFPASYTRFGLHGSICSHLMHLDCFQVYSVSVRQRHRSQATRNHPECIPRKEFICPLCKSLGNVILPVTQQDKRAELNSVPFPDWIRAAGIHILKSKPDPHLDSLQFRNGTGEFVFWSAQDSGYLYAVRKNAERDKQDALDGAKMLDTVMVISKSVSQQSRHLRDRMEPEPSERGAGIYLPEELVGYTIASMEIALRGVGADTSNSGAAKGTMMVDTLSESQTMMIRALLLCLTRLAALQFKNRPDEGRDAVRQAIIKRLLPEWSRSSLTSFSYPLLLRDPFTILVETAAVAPDMIRHVLVLTYYACLARTVIGLVYILNKSRGFNASPIGQRAYADIFGDVRMFFMSVVRHSPVFEHTATIAFDTFGENRIEKLLYVFTLPFLRKAAILCRAILPFAFPTPTFASDDVCEYKRLLVMLGIPPLSDLPRQDTLQNALSGWCAHYGHSHTASQLNCGVLLDYPVVYRLARLPLVLDSLFNRQDKALMCTNCQTFPVDAAICLICGSTVCLQSSCCIDEENNKRGECNMHTRE